MCKQGTEIVLNVPIPHDLAWNGTPHWSNKTIDNCIAPLVQALNNAGIYTASCCCGHSEELGHIWLQDGRVLIILPDATKDTISYIVTK